MYENQLMAGEAILTQSGDQQIILTTHRIRYEDSSFGRARIVSILLENVSSVEVHYRSWVLMLYLGILTGVVGLLAIFTGMQQPESDAQSSGIGALIISGLFVLAYFFSRQHTVSIASKGGAKIQFFTKGLSREEIIGFVDKVDQAMNDRVKSLPLTHSY